MFKLNGPIGAAFDHDLNDVTNTKTALRALGHFKTPDYGLTTYPDQALFDGVKDFQKARNLSVDGVMKPGGETETALAQVAAPAPETPPAPDRADAAPLRWMDGKPDSPTASPAKTAPPLHWPQPGRPGLVDRPPARRRGGGKRQRRDRPPPPRRRR